MLFMEYGYRCIPIQISWLPQFPHRRESVFEIRLACFNSNCFKQQQLYPTWIFACAGVTETKVVFMLVCDSKFYPWYDKRPSENGLLPVFRRPLLVVLLWVHRVNDDTASGKRIGRYLIGFVGFCPKGAIFCVENPRKVSKLAVFLLWIYRLIGKKLLGKLNIGSIRWSGLLRHFVSLSCCFLNFGQST